jgi:hypothetical protein
MGLSFRGVAVTDSGFARSYSPAAVAEGDQTHTVKVIVVGDQGRVDIDAFAVLK